MTISSLSTEHKCHAFLAEPHDPLWDGEDFSLIFSTEQSILYARRLAAGRNVPIPIKS